MHIPLLAAILLALLPLEGLSSEDEEDTFDALDRMLEQSFEEIDLTLEEQFELLDQAMEDAYQRLSSEIKVNWGAGEVRLPGKKEWIDYSEDLTTRRTIDFEKGVVRLERLINLGERSETIIRDMQAAATSIQRDKLTDLAGKDLAVQYAREALQGEGVELGPPPVIADERPVLAGLGEMIPDQDEIVALVKGALVEGERAPSPSTTAPAQRPAATKAVATLSPLSTGKQKISMEIPLPRNFQKKLSDQYIESVLKEAERQELQPSLLFAVMETESSFNPRATSAVPAYGLMQLVPRSGAMDAYNHVYGEKTLLDPEYLYHPGKNVELGSAYLNLLLGRYLRHITNMDSRKLCAIAAYNTGSGNVARAFTGNRSVREAATLINAMTPDQVYDHLRENLPFEETRHYIEKVTKAQRKYTSFDRQAST